MRQRGFILGGAYAYLAIAIGIAIALGAAFQTGRKVERAEWLDQQNTDLREANRATGATYKLYQKEHEAKEQAISKVSASYQKGLKDGQISKETVIADLESGARRLRVNLTGCEAIGDSAAKAAASTSGRNGGAVGYLSETTSRFLVGLASEADDITKQLGACQAVVRADRGE